MVPFALLPPLLGMATPGRTLSALQSLFQCIGTTACPGAQPRPPPDLHPHHYGGYQLPTPAGWERALKDSIHVTCMWVQHPFGQANPLWCPGSCQPCPGACAQAPLQEHHGDCLQCIISPRTASCNARQHTTHQKGDRQTDVRMGCKAFRFALNPVSCGLSSPCSSPKTNPQKQRHRNGVTRLCLLLLVLEVTDAKEVSCRKG